MEPDEVARRIFEAYRSGDLATIQGLVSTEVAVHMPGHNVLAGEQFIASVYMSILNNEELWKSTLLLIVYDEHGGIYDHVEPPACTADEFHDVLTRVVEFASALVKCDS